VKKYLVFSTAILTVLILAILAVACGGGGGTTGTKTYKLKEDATVGKGVWKIISAEKSIELFRTDGNGKFKAEGQFILLQISLKNSSGEAANLTGEEVEIMDGNRNSYTFDSKNNNIYLAAIGKESLTKTPVPAGQTGTGYLIFDISKDAKDLKAKVKDITITGRTFAYIDLNM
jgi:hypothetical protein